MSVGGGPAGSPTDAVPEPEQTTLPIRVIPRAKRTAVGGERAGRLLVRVTAPPADGRANAAVIAALADRLGLPKGRIEIARGAGSRDKTIRLHGVAGDDPRLTALLRTGSSGSPT